MAPGSAAGDKPPKGRGRRKARQQDQSAVPDPGVVPPPGAPSEPPKDPVPLAFDTLPPPPVGSVVWKPAVDPATGQPLWDGPGPTGSVPPPEAPKPSRWRRKKTATGAIVATEVSTATIAVEASATVAEATTSAPPGQPETLAVSPWDDDTVRAGAIEPPIEEPPAKPTGTARNRPLIVLLIVLLLAALGGIAYLLVTRHSTTTSPPAAVVPVPANPDAALARSISLRLTDLPAGWVVAAPGSPTPHLPVPPAATQIAAEQTLASCLGVSQPAVAGLFGGAVFPGHTASARSPVFQSTADPAIQMYSTTEILSTPSDQAALTAPLKGTTFVPCFQQYQTTIVHAAAPGGTVQVAPVFLAAPPGVTIDAFLTTFTIPGQGTTVSGQAFIAGGRILADLQPSTNGPAVPSDAFTPAYLSIADRVSRAAGR
ncbi:MAG: hypothetical protein ACYDES_02745 [Acidimicrobiales bacterium]